MPPEEPRSRLRFTEFEMERPQDGRCRARVTTEWTLGRVFLGEAEGTQTLQGEIRAAATAALSSASQAVGGRLELELRGAKAIRAFDNWIVVVSVKAHSEDGDRRLMGVFSCPDDDTPKGAVMAALDATNRLMEKYLKD